MPKHSANGPAGITNDSENIEETDRTAERLEVERAQEAGSRRGRKTADGDDPIGLTEAFAPVGDEAFEEARAAGDDHIGLTEAFAPVSEGAHAGGFSYKGDNEDEYPDALESLEPQNLPPMLSVDDSAERDSADERVRGRHGKEAPIPAYQHKSRRLRRILIAIIIVLIILLIAAIAAGGLLLHTASQTAVQMAASNQQAAIDDMQDGVDDASMQAKKVVDVPDLASLLGLTQDQAIEAVGHGAIATATSEVNEEGNPIRTSLTIALTDDPADSRSGTPSVYLGLDEGGLVVQAGYSAPTASLGYGSLSFADAVANEHVVEKTLQEAGIPVEEGAAVLPDDKSSYSTYDSDGTTLVRENCTFEGQVDIDGASHSWSSTLSYDYTTANSTDNLADTIRLIYVYLNA